MARTVSQHALLTILSFVAPLVVAWITQSKGHFSSPTENIVMVRLMTYRVTGDISDFASRIFHDYDIIDVEVTEIPFQSCKLLL